MEQHFASLSKRQTMFLLTALAFGGSESVECFEHLPADEAELLKHRAQALLQIPKEQRIPFLVQEIKRLVMSRRKQLASADPERLASLLSRERGTTIEVLLRALPVALADAVRQELPRRGSVKLKRDVPPELLAIIRWKLEEGLKQSAVSAGGFKFTDVLTLQVREVLAICDRMGARALATAFAGLPEAEREALFAKMPPDQRSLAHRASEAGTARKLTERDSRTVLEIFGALENPSLGMRSAGAQRLVRACIAQGSEFVARMIDRHPPELGKLLQRWVRDERARAQRGDGGRTDIVEQMERLAQLGVIDRPMRLPPPPKGPPPDARELPGGKVLAPLPKLRQPAPKARGEGEAFRDAIAQREARKAGAVSSRVPKEPKEEERSSASAPARIMRDGKLVNKDTPKPPPLPRAVASPALQAIPKRRGPSHEGGHSGVRKAVVVKGGNGRKS